MDEAQTMALIAESGKAKVIAVHMDARDHCRTTRKSLSQKAAESNIGKEKLIIPQDGEVIKLGLKFERGKKLQDADTFLKMYQHFIIFEPKFQVIFPGYQCSF